MEPAGDIACWAGAGTGPHWLPGLKCGTLPGSAGAGAAAGTSACWPL